MFIGHFFRYLPSTNSFPFWCDTLSCTRPRLSVWSTPQSFGTLVWHRLWTFMSHAASIIHTRIRKDLDKKRYMEIHISQFLWEKVLIISNIIYPHARSGFELPWLSYYALKITEDKRHDTDKDGSCQQYKIMMSQNNNHLQLDLIMEQEQLTTQVIEFVLKFLKNGNILP